MSNITVGQIMKDAQRMASRVKDLDALGSALLIEAEGNNRIVETLRRFQEDIESLNRISHNKTNADMVNRIQQQNANSMEILKENRELKFCIEDYERALDLIMHKYREHTSNKLIESKINFKELYNERLWRIIREQRDKINEMAAVMSRAASIDDVFVKDMEMMSLLQMENKSLRELLQISKQFGSCGQPIRYNEYELVEKAVQTDSDESIDELSLSSVSIENTNSAIHVNVNSTTVCPSLSETEDNEPLGAPLRKVACNKDADSEQPSSMPSSETDQLDSHSSFAAPEIGTASVGTDTDTDTTVETPNTIDSSTT